VESRPPSMRKNIQNKRINFFTEKCETEETEHSPRGNRKRAGVENKRTIVNETTCKIARNNKDVPMVRGTRKSLAAKRRCKKMQKTAVKRLK